MTLIAYGENSRDERLYYCPTCEKHGITDREHSHTDYRADIISTFEGYMLFRMSEAEHVAKNYQDTERD